MTNPQTENSNSWDGTHVAALVVVLLLVGVTLLNLPSPSVPPSKPVTPYVTVITAPGVSVRNGPSLTWYPPVGSLAVNQKTEILAHSPDGLWFKIRYYNGAGWVPAAAVKPSVDLAQIPVDAGPPVPTLSPSPPTAAPIPTANTLQNSSSSANLVLGNISLNPPLPISCGKTASIAVDVANLGSEATATMGSIRIRDVVASNGQEVSETTGAFGPIKNGQTVNISGMFLTVTQAVGEEHQLIITINPDGRVPETSNADNSREFTYTLQGNCG